MNTTSTYNRIDDSQLLQDFIALLLRKGYDGHFMLQSPHPPTFYTGPIEICMQKFIDGCKGIFPPSPSLTLTTDFSADQRSPPYFCALTVQFNPAKGWTVQKQSIRQFGIPQHTDIDLAANKELKPFKDLPQLLRPKRPSPLRRVLSALMPKRKI